MEVGSSINTKEKSSGWTEAMVADLKRHWNEGEITAPEIAKLLNLKYGTSFTGNAVVSKANREGFPARQRGGDTRSKNRRDGIKTPGFSGGPETIPYPDSQKPRTEAEGGYDKAHAVPYAERKCQYPIAIDGMGCGAPKKLRSSYCVEHHRRTHRSNGSDA